MNINLENKIVLVTGASKGIGREVALTLASEGATVIICARNEEQLNKTFNELKLCSKNPHFAISLDLQKEGSPKLLADSIIENFGKLDILIHNLGGSLQVTDIYASANQWEKVFGFNVGIGIDLNNYFIPLMRKNGWGRIIHISSIAAVTLKGNPAYAVAKAALNSYIELMGKELAKFNIILSGVMPGPVLVEGRFFDILKNKDSEAYNDYFLKHVGIQRISTTKEIANYVLFLASDFAGYNPGAIWKIDGATL